MRLPFFIAAETVFPAAAAAEVAAEEDCGCAEVAEGAGLGGELDTDEEAGLLGPLHVGGGGVVEVEVDVFVGFLPGKLGFEEGGDEG